METVNKEPAPQSSADTVWQSDVPCQKSWGDLLKDSLHWWATDIGVNYFANATISVGLTYLFEKTKGENYNKWLKGQTDGIPNKMAKSVAQFAIRFLTKSQILLMGGHFLVPLMKDFNDNRHRQSEWMGDKLDALQEMLGQGNDASRKNRSDYAMLHNILRDKPKDVSPEQARILVKYGVNSSFDFIEEKRTWKEVILSRLRAMGFSAVTNAAIGGAIEAPSTQKDAAGQEIKNSGLYSRAWANPISKWLGKGFSKVPGFKKAFPDTELFAREYANDVILTAASTIGFMQGMKAAEKNGPSHEEMRARNTEYWTQKVLAKEPQQLAQNAATEAPAASFAEHTPKFDSRAQMVTDSRETSSDPQLASR